MGSCWLKKAVFSLGIGQIAMAQVLPTPAVAQSIAVDDTLGQEGSRLTNRSGRVEIEGGARRGRNLFHSFREFNIREGQRVYFTNPSGVRTIFSRVTGNSDSAILGTLGVNGPASLVLLNPNGIRFGANARLDLQGSFLATTASSILFEQDNVSFSATNPQAPPLLTVSVPTGLQFGPNPGSIINRSRAASPRDSAIGLQVGTGQTLALVGGTVAVEGGRLTAAGGRIELGSVAANGFVRLNSIDGGWDVGYRNNQQANFYQDIDLTNGALLNAAEAEGGVIQIRGRNVTLTDASRIVTNTQAAKTNRQDNAIRVFAAETLSLQSGSRLEIVTNRRGPVRNIDLQARELEIRGASEQDQASGIFSGTVATPEDTNSNTGNEPSPESNNENSNGGNVENQGDDNIDLSGSNNGNVNENISTNPGDTGNILVRVGRTVRLEDGAEIGITTNDEQDSGNLQISGFNKRFVNQFNLSDQARLSTRGGRRGGAITINARTVNLNQQSQIETAQHSGQTDRNGAIFIDAQQIRLTQASQIRVDQSSGTQANIALTTPLQTGRIVLDDSAITTRSSTGGANIRLRTNQLALNQSQLSTESGSERGGNLSIIAQTSIRLNNSELSTVAGSGGGANLRLQNANPELELRESLDVRLTNRSRIQTQSLVRGGNILINVRRIEAPIGADSDIIARRPLEQGGKINILVGNEAEDIIGFVQGRAIAGNGLNEIDAAAGVVITEFPAIEVPEIQLPSDALAARSVAQGCESIRNETSESVARFFNTGRSGLSVTPYEPVSNSDVLADIRLPNSPDSQTNASTPIVEAKGWIRDAHGNLSLVANSPLSANCQVR